VDETELWSLIQVADEELLRTANGRGTRIKFNENHAWPGKLTILLHESSVDELLEIQFAIERYYAGRINTTEDHLEQDELIALAYLRTVRLQFERNEPDMGFTQREFNFVRAAIGQHPGSWAEEPNILEVGCGAGSLLASLAESGYRRLAGVDLALPAVEKANQRLGPYGLAGRVRQATVGDLLEAGHVQAFDVILLCDVLEHIPRERAGSLLAEARQLLRAGGMLITVTPNAFTGPHDVTRHFRPSGSTPEGLHIHEYVLGELTSLLAKSGFSHFTGMRLRNCFPWSGQMRLGGFSVRFRMAMERAFPYMPMFLTRITVDRLYFSALCARSVPG
jgi:2-polyprenyl-3-methyl-5-hydroxy-6-metoxy-1,4-benzoquinol methylase